VRLEIQSRISTATENLIFQFIVRRTAFGILQKVPADIRLFRGEYQPIRLCQAITTATVEPI
jgi:hypothetical protein